jgi:hypothetical protein
VGVEAGLLGATPVLGLPVPGHGHEPRRLQFGVGPERSSHRVTIHAGQADVAKDDLRPLRARRAQPGRTVVRDAHGATLPFEKVLQALCHVLVVLDHEHLGVAKAHGLGRSRRRVLIGRFRQGKAHLDLGPEPRSGTRGAHLPTVQLDEPLDERQTEPEASARSGDAVWRLLERLEDPRQHFRCHAGARVADRPATPQWLLLVEREADLDCPARRRELLRIGEQVTDDLSEPGRVAVDPHALGGKLHGQRDTTRLEARAPVFGHGSQKKTTVDGCPLESQPAAFDS